MSTKNSKVYHGDQEQELSGAEETALIEAGIITTVGENLGRLEYAICAGFTWGDVDAALAAMNQPSAASA